MPDLTLQQAFDLALQHHQAGRLQPAAEIYRQIITADSAHAESMHYLGVIALQTGRADAAVELIRRAIAISPRYAVAYNNLGIALKGQGLIDEAIAAYSQAVVLQSEYPEAWHHLGLALTEKSQFIDAIAAHRRAVALRPNYAEAFSDLGNALREQGQIDDAIAAYRQAIALRPDYADAYYNLGIALEEKGNLAEAIAAYRQAIAIRPDLPEAFCNLGTALKKNDQLTEAVAAYRRAISLRPDFPEAFYNLGAVLTELHQPDEAISSLRRAITLRPHYAEACNNLGNALKATGQVDEAVAAYRHALVINPRFVDAQINLGNAMLDRRDLHQAIEAYRQAIALKPELAEAHNNLAMALVEQGDLAEGIAACRRALELNPEFPEAYLNLGNALKDQGRLDEAIAAYRQASRYKPEYAEAHSNLVLAIHYHADFSAREIAEENAKWNAQYVEPLKKFIESHSNDRNPDRRLRIGYVSPDFREHVVGRNLLPLFQRRDHGQFEVTGYAQVPCADELTREFERSADRWRSIVGLSDEHVARQIREDQIDILMDLTLHTGNNRLLVFARKPAPVQVSYLGYAGSTGMSAMNYRLSDPFLDPPEVDLSCYSEKTMRLPRSYWCYQPRPGPEVSPPPVETKGFVTFGCLNNFAKVSSAALELWAKIVLAVPNSRLILHAKAGDHLDDVRWRVAGWGVSEDRLEFVGLQPWEEYARTYSRIDIALDPFPYGGGITTCDALWMGAPVVSLSGRTAVGRGGRSILSNIGLPELVAYSPEQYLQIAADLATDRDRMASLRKSMRERMAASPLLDADAFTRDIESAYRQMWRESCAG